MINMSPLIDVTEQLDRFHCRSKARLTKLDVVLAHRSEVKHYPLDDLAQDVSEVNTRLENMVYANWMSFEHYLRLAIAEKYPNDVERVLKYDGKIGVVKVANPNRFMYVGRTIEKVKIYGFTYTTDDGRIQLKTEMNYSIEIYNLDMEKQ